MRRNCKRVLSFVLAFAMVWGIITPNTFAKAAKAVKLSTKTVSVKVGATKKIQVKNTKKTVKWSIKSGKKQVSLTSKKKTSVKVKGKKAGKAVILAKVGKKKLICKVTVKKATKKTDKTPQTPTKTPAVPTVAPTTAPTTAPTAAPTIAPTTVPSAVPSVEPTAPVATATAGATSDPNAEAVQDINVDLTGLTTEFTGTPCKIDFSSKIDSRVDLALFDSLEVGYTLEFANGDSSSWNCGKIAVAVTPDTLNGFDDGIVYNGYSMSATETTNTIDLTGETIVGHPLGINIQPMDASFSWPTGLTKMTITSIKFIAKEGAVYPPAGATPKPTEVPLPTYEPKEFVYEGLDTSWIDPSKPMVAFTFDDGPVGIKDTDTSMIIQKTLHDNGCHATFNYIGSQISSDDKKAEIKQALSYGFELGNHSWNWSSMSSMKDTAVRKSIEDTNAILSELTEGKISNFTFRPPNLAVGGKMVGNIDAPFIDCAIDSADWNNATTEQIIAKVETAKDGDIILMHETQATTAEAMPALVKYFKDKGWQIVSVSELFAVRNTPLMTGTVYKKCPPAN